MGGNNTIDDDDRDLFRSSVGQVSPLRNNNVVHDLDKKSKPGPYPRQSMADERQVLVELADGSNDPEFLETGDELQFKRDGIQQSQFRKLQRGQIKIEHEVDLHGMTIAMARSVLAEFLTEARSSHWRCIRIIHGKGINSPNGIPVLKGKLNQWLRQRDEVLAFCSAQPRDGGTGALYVLLKRAR